MTASLAVFAAAVTITAAGLAAVAVGSLVAGWKAWAAALAAAQPFLPEATAGGCQDCPQEYATGGGAGPGEPRPAVDAPSGGCTLDDLDAALTAPSPTLKELNTSGYNTLNKRCRAIHAEHGSSDKATAGAQWEALAYAESGGRTTHLSELTPDEANRFRTRMVDVGDGRAVWVETDDPKWLGWTLRYNDEVAA